MFRRCSNIGLLCILTIIGVTSYNFWIVLFAALIVGEHEQTFTGSQEGL